MQEQSNNLWDTILAIYKGYRVCKFSGVTVLQITIYVKLYIQPGFQCNDPLANGITPGSETLARAQP